LPKVNKASKDMTAFRNEVVYSLNASVLEKMPFPRLGRTDVQ